MENSQALELLNLAKQGSSRAFTTLWDGTVGMVNPYKYFDPTDAYTREDFLQLTRIGLHKAIITYQEGRGSTPLSWIRTLMSQALQKELKKIARNPYVMSLDTPAVLNRGEVGNLTVEEMIYKQLVSSSSYRAFKNEFDENQYYYILKEVQSRIADNIRPLKVFNLKLAFPKLKRDTISIMLGYSRPALTNYFIKIKTVISVVVREMERDYGT